MSDNIGILLDKPIPPIKNDFNFYYRILYKWENSQRIDAHEKTCEFIYRKSSSILCSDIRYVELIVYNLINNAIKYAYDGTKIYLHFSEDDKKLTVTNFTFPISQKEEKNIFELGYRREKAEELYSEGTGIGLWLVESVVKLLEGKIKLCSQIIIFRF